MIANPQMAFQTHSAMPDTETELILARVRTLCQRRLLWLRHLQQRDDQLQSKQSPLDNVLLDYDCPTAEADFYDSQDAVADLNRYASRITKNLASMPDSRFHQLVSVLGLAHCEADLLQICLACSIDPELSAVYGALSGVEGRAAPTESLAARICGYGRQVMMTPTGALLSWKIISVEQIEPGDPPILRLDPYIRSYLLGNDELDPSLVGCCTPCSTNLSPLPDWPVNVIAQRIADAFGRKAPSLVQIMAPPMSGRRTFAVCIAKLLGSTVLAIDTAKIPDKCWDEIRLKVQRQALLHSCAVSWCGSQAARGPLGSFNVLPLEFTIIETSSELANAIGWHEERVELPALSSDVRRQLWLRMLPTANAWSDAQLQHLSQRYCATVGEIVHIATQGETEFEKVCALTRELSRGKLGELAQLIDCPFVRTDLLVPTSINNQLEEFMFEASERVTFWEQPSARRLFPRGTGLIGLLAGPPGTGKTMAAQIIAAELGLDLFRIDLATTMNKYIGETAKNLRRLFMRAANMNAVLLFDEADALFAKRTNVRDSNDRHANSDTNYLLQLVEDYPGVALLATNKRQQLDDAFVRRVRYTFYFTRPDATQRLGIWQQTVSQLSSVDCAQRLASDLEQIAAQTNVTGAQIKNAVLAAVFLARREQREMHSDDLRRGLERQLSDHGNSPSLERAR